MKVSQTSKGSGAGRRKVLLAALILIFILATFSTLILAYIVLQPQIPAFLQASTITPSSTSTPQCVRSSLTLGGYIYPLDVTYFMDDGSLPIIPGPPGNAWWVSDTSSPFVIIVDPASRSLDLKKVLSTGDRMEIQRADCSREEFVYTDFEPTAPDSQNLIQQTEQGIVVYVQPVGTDQAYQLLGKRPEIVNPPTLQPTSSIAIQVGITVEESAVSVDGTSLQIHVAITNRGSQRITLTENDLSLTPEGQPLEKPLQTVPALNLELKPGTSLPIVITFANPGGHTAVFRVFDVTVNVGY